jgi:hypothetical protein
VECTKLSFLYSLNALAGALDHDLLSAAGVHSTHSKEATEDIYLGEIVLVEESISGGDPYGNVFAGLVRGTCRFQIVELAPGRRLHPMPLQAT